MKCHIFSPSILCDIPPDHSSSCIPKGSCCSEFGVYHALVCFMLLLHVYVCISNLPLFCVFLKLDINALMYIYIYVYIYIYIYFFFYKFQFHRNLLF